MIKCITLSARGLIEGLRDMVIGVAIVLAIASFANCESGCGGLPGRTPTALEQAYTAEIVACAATSASHEEDEKCRRNVNNRYGLP